MKVGVLILLIVAPLTGVTSPAVAGNFVAVRKAPFPYFIDTQSVRYDGDNISFDTLDVGRYFELHPATKGATGVVTPAATSSHYFAALNHLRVSCGWRTARASGVGQSFDEAGHPTPQKRFGAADSHDGLIAVHSPIAAFVDQRCGNATDPVPSGYWSASDATTAAEADLANSGSALPLMIAPPPETKSPAWMGYGEPHRFAVIAGHGAHDNLLFFERTATVPNDRSVAGLSLTILGVDAQRDHGPFGSMSAVVSLERVRFDCAANTMSVEAQALWAPSGKFDGAFDRVPTARHVDESPVTAATIRAACAPPRSKPIGPVFASVDDAWASARSLWPPRSDPLRSVCGWVALPHNVSAGIESDWSTERSELYKVFQAVPVQAFLRGCGVSSADIDAATTELRNYAKRMGALSALNRAHGLSTTRLRNEWQTASWRDQQRFIWTQQASTADDRTFRSQLVARMGAELGLSSYDEFEWLQDFLEADGVLDSD